MSHALDRLSKHVPVLSAGVATMLAIVWHWSAFSRLDTHVIGWAGDNIAYAWLIHHAARVVREGGSFWFDPYSYYPLGYNLTAIESTLSNVLLALPIALLFGPIVAYNLVVLLSFTLTALGTALWVRALTRSSWIAFALGVASAFLPYRLAHLPGHMPLIATQWMPLCLFGVERYFATRHVRWAVFAGLMFALNALASWHYLVFLGIALPIYVALRAPRSTLVRAAFLRHALVAAAVGIAPVLPVGIPYIRAQQQEERVRSLAQITSLSISPAEFFTLSIRHPIWGEWAATHLASAKDQNIVEQVVMPGYIVLGAALVGVVLSRRRRVVRTLVALALVGAIGALGPVLVDAAQQPVRIALPGAAASVVQHIGATPLAATLLGSELAAQLRTEQPVVVLPYALVHQIPGLSSVRGVGRFALLMNFALIGLAGLGLHAVSWRIARWVRRRSSILIPWAIAGVVLLGGVLLEYWQKPHFVTNLAPRPVDRWLQAQPSGAVLELPLLYPIQRRALFAHVYHRHPLILGLAGSFPPSAEGERRSVIERLPAPEAVQALCAWQTRYIVVHTARPAQPPDIERWTQTLEQIPQAHLATELKNARVYALMGCSESAFPKQP